MVVVVIVIMFHTHCYRADKEFVEALCYKDLSRKWLHWSVAWTKFYENSRFFTIREKVAKPLERCNLRAACQQDVHLSGEVTPVPSSGFFSLRLAVIFLLKHFGHWDVSVICLTVLLKLTVTVFISLYIQTFDRNDLFFISVISKKIRPMTENKTSLSFMSLCWVVCDAVCVPALCFFCACFPP